MPEININTIEIPIDEFKILLKAVENFIDVMDAEYNCDIEYENPKLWELFWKYSKMLSLEPDILL